MPGYISVAGIDGHTGRHVRPVVVTDRLSSNHLVSEGGIFDLGCVVQLASAQPCGTTPHIEDCTFDPAATIATDVMTGAKFFQLMLENAQHDVTSIFGPDLCAQGMSGWLVPPGKGIASLGLLAPIEAPELWLKPRAGQPDQIRITFRDRALTRDLPVTDLRLFADDFGNPKEREIERLNSIIHREKKVVLGLALTRACSRDGLDSKVHWLYVSGIHWSSTAIWRLGNINQLN